MPQLILIILGVVFILMAIVYVVMLLAIIAAIALFVVAFNYGVAQIISVKPLSVYDYKKISMYSYVVMILGWFLFQTFVYPAQSQESGSYFLSAIFWPWIIFSHILSAENSGPTIFHFTEYGRLLYSLAAVYFFSLLGTSFTYLWNNKQRSSNLTEVPRLKTTDFWITALFVVSVLLVPAYLVSGRLIAITTGKPFFANAKNGPLIKAQITSNEFFRRSGNKRGVRNTHKFSSIYNSENVHKLHAEIESSEVKLHGTSLNPVLILSKDQSYEAWGAEASHWVVIAEDGRNGPRRQIGSKHFLVKDGGYLINTLTGAWHKFETKFETIEFSPSGYFILLINRRYKLSKYNYWKNRFNFIRIPSYEAHSGKKLEIYSNDSIGRRLWGAYGRYRWFEKLDNKYGAFGNASYQYSDGSTRSSYFSLPRNPGYYQ